MASPEFMEKLSSVSRLSVRLSAAELHKMQALVESLKLQLHLRVLSTVKAHVSEPLLLVYQSDGTRAKVRRTHFHAAPQPVTNFLRNLLEGSEYLCQVGYLLARPLGGTSPDQLLLGGPVPLKKGERSWAC